MKDFSFIISPLNKFVKKDFKFAWNKNQEKAFNLLNEKLCSTPILVLFNFKKIFELKCNV